MQRIRPDVDIVKDILEAVLAKQPASEFVQSLLKQYQDRGGLSKKQLEGLYQKAMKVAGIPPGKLATLEAIILKKHTRFRSSLPDSEPLFIKDVEVGEMISQVLQKQPAHKRVLFFQSKYENNEVLTAAELTELKKFRKLFS